MDQSEFKRLLKAQEELEDFSYRSGRKRYFRAKDGATRGGRGSTVGSTRLLLREVVEPVADALSWKMDFFEGRRGRRPVAFRYMVNQWDHRKGTEQVHGKLGVDTMGFLTARAVLDTIQKPTQLSDIARRLGKFIEHELRFRYMQKEAPGLFKYREENFSGPSYHRRARDLELSLTAMQCEECLNSGALDSRENCPHIDLGSVTLGPKERLKVGMWLVADVLEPATDLIEIQRIREGRKTKVMVTPTEEALEILSKRDSFLADLRPVRMPMVLPPLDWTDNRRGGYRYALREAFPLVRSSGKQAADREGLDLEVVREAVNGMQRTAWQVNLDAWELVAQIQGRGGGQAGVPVLEDPPEPTWENLLPRFKRGDPGNIDPNYRILYEGFDIELLDVPGLQECKINPDTGKLDAPERETFRTLDSLFGANLRKHRQTVEKLRSARAVFYRTLGVLKKVYRERFYFPYNLDFRGRVYPMPDYLSPQGSDLEKGLLEFADATPMGDTGGDWLAIHVANCVDTTPDGLKVSKLTLEERIEWVDQNQDLLFAYAEDPFGAGRWGLEAEEPIQLYAAAKEWTRWADSGFSPDYKCGLVIGQDGSCNGLQHFAMALRDPVAARAVNVSAYPEPQDVYLRVAEAVLQQVRRDAGHGDEVASLWLSYRRPLIDRKRVKRMVMTTPYGSKIYGFNQQLQEEAAKEDDWDEIQAHFGEQMFHGFQYLAETIWNALDEVVLAAKEAMSWMQECARTIVRDGECVRWQVPITNFPVLQGYMETDRIQVTTVIAGGTRITTEWHDPKDTPKTHRQVNAVSPNVVHSLDAAHLMLTVYEARKRGIESFGMVHDSYGTTPGQSQALADCLREQFLLLYSRPVFEEIRAQWQDLTEEPLPPAPEQGTFDPHEVLRSKYFFS